MSISLVQLLDGLSLEETNPNDTLQVARDIIHIIPFVEQNKRMAELMGYVHETVKLAELPEPARTLAVIQNIEKMVKAFRKEFNTLNAYRREIHKMD